MALYNAMKRQVSNRGAPPDTFLDELIRWALSEPLELFAPNSLRDVYATTASVLGPWRGLEHRRAAMVEILRVLAGFESSWRWDVGRDITNPNVDRPMNEETGPFQVSADSMALGRSLRAYVVAELGDASPAAFIRAMKELHQFAIGYAARVLRLTVNHHGPVKRLEINPWLSRDSVLEIERILRETTTALSVARGTEEQRAPARKEDAMSMFKDLTAGMREALAVKTEVMKRAAADYVDGGWPTLEAVAMKWARKAEDEAYEKGKKAIFAQSGFIAEIESRIDWARVPESMRIPLRSLLQWLAPYLVEGQVVMLNYAFDHDWAAPVKSILDRVAHVIEPVIDRDINNDGSVGKPPTSITVGTK